MAFYVSLASKLERAGRALLILQGKDNMDAAQFAANGDCFVANDSRSRNVLPNRTCIVTSVNPIRSNRPESVLHLQIQHKFDAALQPDDTNLEQQRLIAENYLGDTMDTMGIGDDNSDQAMSQLADALTAAGRWLATPDPNGKPGDDADKIVQNNLDMTKFRVDWIKRGTPFLVRGEADNKDSTIWVEILNFEAGVSYATN